MHIEESITLATSITKQKADCLCILKPVNVSPFRVIIVSSKLVRFMVCGSNYGCGWSICGLWFVKKEVQMLLFQTSREIKFYFQHFIQICFYFLGKKVGVHGRPPPRPLPLLRHCINSSPLLISLNFTNPLRKL